MTWHPKVMTWHQNARRVRDIETEKRRVTFESMIHRELFTWKSISWPSWFSALYLRGLFSTLQTWKKKRGMDLFPFLLASVNGAAQAAGAPVAASLAREITQSCSLGYILLYSSSSFYFYFVLCLSLSYDMICIFIRGSEPPWSVYVHRKLLIKIMAEYHCLDDLTGEMIPTIKSPQIQAVTWH